MKRKKGRRKRGKKKGEEGRKEEKERGKVSIFGIGIGKTLIAVFAGIVLLYFAGFAYFFFTGENPTFSVVEREGKLEKVVPVQITAGESYLYEYRVNNTPIFKVGYDIGKGDGCTLITQSFSSNITARPICVDRWGNERDWEGNLTYRNNTVYLFSPWMLALKNGWEWEVNITMGIEGFDMESTTGFLFEVVSEEKKFGRDVYKVRVTVSEDGGAAGEPILWWIDREKRILIAQEMGEDKIRLVNAPFTLEQQAG